MIKLEKDNIRREAESLAAKINRRDWTDRMVVTLSTLLLTLILSYHWIVYYLYKILVAIARLGHYFKF